MTPDASRQAVVEAALVLLERIGLSPADLIAVPPPRKPVPTFAVYVPLVSAAVSGPVTLSPAQIDIILSKIRAPAALPDARRPAELAALQGSHGRCRLPKSSATDRLRAGNEIAGRPWFCCE